MTASQQPVPGEPATLASTVRGLDAAELSRLLSLRPDLGNPAPRNLVEVSSRASTRASVRAAVAGLDAWRLRLLLSLAALGDLTVEELADALCAGFPDMDPDTLGDDVRGGLDDLCDRVLVLRQGDRFHVVSVVSSQLSAHPAGLAPVSPTPMTPGEIRERLEVAGPAARTVLERLMWSPTGRVPNARRPVRPDTAATPVEMALAHRLLRPVEDDTVILPREVSLVLREGRLFPDPPRPAAPDWPPTAHPDRIDQAGLGTALEAVSAMSALLEGVERHHCAQLANGGMAKRDASTVLSRVAAGRAGWLHLALAVAGGLIAADGRGWLPTPLADHWRADSLWGQWVGLREAWLAVLQTPGHIDNSLAAPAPAGARAWRRLVHEELSTAEPGTPVDADTVAARIAWRQPGVVGDELTPMVEAVLAECAVLGMVALSSRTDLVTAVSREDMPERTDRIILQSDLTAVAPGPLTPDAAADLALLADRESTGVAGVRRFTRASLRRALDAGWTGQRVRTWWSDHSLTEVPQGLLVLLGDVVRDHGRVSVAAAGSVLEVDDPAAVETLLHSPAATGLGLRRVSSRVIVSQAEPESVLAELRGLGMAPVARDAHGDTLTAPPSPRARVPASPEPVPETDPDDLAAALLDTRDGHVGDHRQLLSDLHRAQQEGTWLEVGSVTDDGTPLTQTLRVLAVSGGVFRAVVRGGGGVRLIPVARVTSCRPARDEPRP